MPAKYDREELAWAAGFFDGEGTTFAAIRENGRRADGARMRGASMRVPQAGEHAEALVRRFQSAVGGLGRIYGPNAPQKSGWKIQWCWAASSFEHVQAVVALLWHWWGPAKREQATKALLIWHSFPSRRKMTSQRGKDMANKRWNRALEV